VTVDLPDRAGRLAILRLYAAKVPLAGDVDLDALAHATPGFAGADLANLINEAALAAARHNHAQVTRADMEEALDKILLGIKRSTALDESERRTVAYHEGGHAIVASVLPKVDPVQKVTIVPRGRSLGVTQFLPLDDKHNYPRSYLIEKMGAALGGRTAEELVCGEITSGAENDLKEVARMARRMVLDWGMGRELGPLALNVDGDGRRGFLGSEPVGERLYSEQTGAVVDAEIRRIVEEAHTKAREALRTHEAALHRLAAALLEHEVVERDEIAAIINATAPSQAPETEQPAPVAGSA
jgi:cell division protease FtsH